MGTYISEAQNEITPIREIPNPSEKRLVKRLQLEYAYDHANPRMRADILLHKVVEHYRFNDMLQMAYYYGLDMLKIKVSEVYGDDQPRRVKQLLRNIESGFNEARLECWNDHIWELSLFILQINDKAKR